MHAFGVNDEHFREVARAWDARGQPLSLTQESVWHIAIAPTDGPADPDALRELLIRIQQPSMTTGLSTMKYEDLIGLSYQRLRLRTTSELIADTTSRAGCCAFPFWALSPALFRRRRAARG